MVRTKKVMHSVDINIHVHFFCISVIFSCYRRRSVPFLSFTSWCLGWAAFSDRGLSWSYFHRIKSKRRDRFV